MSIDEIVCSAKPREEGIWLLRGSSTCGWILEWHKTLQDYFTEYCVEFKTFSTREAAEIWASLAHVEFLELFTSSDLRSMQASDSHFDADEFCSFGTWNFVRRSDVQKILGLLE